MPRYHHIEAQSRHWGGIHVILVKNKLLDLRSLFWRHHPDLNWGIKLLQSFALPLGYGATRLSTLMSVRCSRTSLSLERETRYSLPALTVEHCFNQLRESCRFADSRTRGCRARRLCLYAARVLRCHWSERRDIRFRLSLSSIASINFAKAAALRTAELADVALDAYFCTQLAYFDITGARDEIRTRDICLGKATLYH